MQKYCYRVRSGGTTRVVLADCPATAVEKFLVAVTKRKNAPMLGALTECSLMIPDLSHYESTEHALKRFGLWSPPALTPSPNASSPS